MTVTVYKSTDSSAPSLTGQVGSLVALLDAILVNGYGSKAAQGWTKAFSGTNAASYRQPTSGANGRYLDVADNGTGSAAYARVVGYESMTALATGTAPFPTAAQFSGGLYCHKSSSADSTARPWFAYGNGKFFWLWIATDSGASTPVLGGMGFGDFASYVSGDTFNTCLIAGTTTSASVTSSNNHMGCIALAVNFTNLAGHYVCRGYAGTGASLQFTKFTNSSMSGVSSASAAAWPMGGPTNMGGTSGVSGGMLTYPNGADSGLYMERLWCADSSAIRGELPGIWAPLHSNPLSHLDTFSGAGTLAGKTFEVLRSAVGAGSTIEFFMETSDTW